jgi:hypothetical protein
VIAPTRRVSAVVVNYNVRELLLNCLDSLHEARERGELDEIIVIDSTSDDGSACAARRRYPDIEVLVVPNRGYGAAANTGIALARADAVLVLNSDTVVQHGAISTLSEHMFSRNDVGVAGPRLRYADGSTQPTRRRFPTRWTPVFESTILEEWFPDNRWCRSYRLSGGSDSEAREVDWLVGAALMVRGEAVDQVGGFDESFRMYGEELEWCHRFRRHGWRVVFVPDASIVHHEGASTGQNPLRSRLEFDRGRVRAQSLIHGDRAARIVAGALRLNYAVHLARESLKWLVGHRRDLRAQRMRGYWSLVRSSLYGE